MGFQTWLARMKVSLTCSRAGIAMTKKLTLMMPMATNKLTRSHQFLAGLYMMRQSLLARICMRHCIW